MTKIKNYAIKNPVIAQDKWIGTSGLDGITTKNFTAQDVADFVTSGLSPVEGGTLGITEIDIATLDTDVATTVNAMSPAYDVAQYELVVFNIEGIVYILKVVDTTIGVGGTTLTNGDFIELPANTGPAGATGNGIESIVLYATVGLVKTYRITFTDATTFDFDVTDGADGSDGLNADMTRTSTTSLAIASSGTKTLNYTASSNLGWLVGTRLRFFHDSNSYMEGQVTAVSSTSVSISVDYKVGSGTYTSWNIGVAGDVGSSGTYSNAVIENTSGTLVITSQSIANLDYNLKFQLDNGKCFIWGYFDNNTGIDTSGTTVLSILNSSYMPNANTAYITNIIGFNDTGAICSFVLAGSILSVVGTIPNGDRVYINGYYYL